jgi:hypothetical protein
MKNELASANLLTPYFVLDKPRKQMASAGLRADDHFGEKDKRRLNIKKNPKLKAPRKK